MYSDIPQPGPPGGNFATDAWSGNSGAFIGVPAGYMNQIGWKPPSKANQYASQFSYNLPPDMQASLAPQESYVKPIYKYNDLNSLWGAPKSVVLPQQARLVALGYMSASDATGIYDETTRDAMANAMATANMNGWTLEQMAAMAKSGGLEGLSGSSGAAAPQPRTVVSTSVNLTGRSGAMQVLTQALTNDLGREPTKVEIDRFLKSLNAEERANPQVTTTHYSADRNDVSSTVEQSDVDPTSEAQQWSKGRNKKEAQRYQSGNYYEVIASMVGM